VPAHVPTPHAIRVSSHSRPQVKRPFELKCDIEWEIALTDSERCEGVTSYVEISPAPSSARMPCTYETSEHFTAPPKGDEVVVWPLRSTYPPGRHLP